MEAVTWLELSVEVDNEAVEAVSELLARYGYNGGVVVEPAWTPGDEGPEFTYDTSRPTVLRTYLPLDERAEEVRQQIEQALWHLGQMRPVGVLQARTLQEEDWGERLEAALSRAADRRADGGGALVAGVRRRAR